MKYQADYRNHLEDDDEDNETVVQPVKKQEEETSLSAEEASWKKRYGDLRRHQQETETKLKKEIEGIKAQLDTASKAQIKFPKSLDEVKEWEKKYPDIAAIVDTIAQMRVLEAQGHNQKELSRVRELEEKIEKEKGEMELRKRHPDFDEIRSDPDFHEWLSEKAPKWCRTALYEDGQPVDDADEAIDYYKTKVLKKNKKPDTSAGKAVGVKSVHSAPATGSKWTESKVERLSERDYEKFEDEIMHAMKTDPGFYDLSGGAR